MERLKTAGLWGLAIIFMIIMLPITLVSFVITTKLMFAFLGIALALAVIGYIVFLPATVLASLTGREDDPKFVFIVAGIVAVLIIGGLAWFSLDQRAKSDVIRQRLIADVRAGKQMLCDHPDASGSRPMFFPAGDLNQTVQRFGWTCWTGGDDVYHPRGEEPFVDRFEFPYD